MAPTVTTVGRFHVDAPLHTGLRLSAALSSYRRSMDSHISVFRPYAHGPHHEDQLTRATMVVLRLVPLAHEALLGLIDAGRLSSLPSPRFDMQTECLVPLGSSAEDQQVEELVSVFLAPHENLDAAQNLNLASERRARYDGVVQYGSRLLIAIESKLYATAVKDQSIDIAAGLLQSGKSRWKQVKWHELLDQWWNLTELDVLSPAELALLADFFDYTEEFFGELLPFSDLSRSGGNQRRRTRRLRKVLQDATGRSVETSGALNIVKFSEEVTALQRAVVWSDDAGVHLGLWPAELTPQAKKVFGERERVERLVQLANQPQWHIKPNIHLSFFRASPHNRWYPQPHLDGATYLMQWLEDLPRAGRRPRAEIESPEFAEWMVKRGYADEGDLVTLTEWLGTYANSKLDLRPSVAITRSWDMADAVQLDRTGALARQVREAIDDVLAILDEPALTDQHLG